jgi:hypothetical protein
MLLVHYNKGTTTIPLVVSCLILQMGIKPGWKCQRTLKNIKEYSLYQWKHGGTDCTVRRTMSKRRGYVWWSTPVILILTMEGRDLEHHGSSPSRAKSSWDPISSNSWEWGCAPAIPATRGSTKRRNAVQACPGIKWDQTAKITKTKRAERVAQMVQHLHSKSEALSSTSSTVKKKRRNI